MRASAKRAIGKAVAAFLMISAGLSLSPATAQTAPPPPNYDNRDENGVDRVTGRFAIDIVEGGIGGDGGVTMVRHQSGLGRDNWSGELIRTASGSTQYATITFAKISERFIKTGSTWTADKANGATLTENIADTQYTYRAPDGTTIVYQSPLALGATTSFNPTTAPQCQAAYGSGVLLCAIPTSIARPNGQSYALTWTTPEGCLYPNNGGGPIIPGGGAGEEEIVCTVWYRLTDVRSNSSFAMKIKYQTDVGPGATDGNAPPPAWFKRSTLKFLDLSQVYCDAAAYNCDGVAGSWPTVSYATPASGVFEIINSQTGTWRIDNATSGQTKIRRPGETADSMVVTYNTTTNRVSSVTRDGATITYNWTTSGANTTSTATTGGGETDAVTSNPTPEQPTTVTAGTSAATTYVYDANKRVIKETRPEGDYTEYTRDARGNVTQTKQIAKPGSGIADIITTANYDATCSNPAKCNSPNWTQDALGNRTNYTYDTAHGQVTKVQMPSPTADAAGTETGTRPEINYSYTPLFAQLRNSGGTLVAQSEAEAKLTQITSCATAATCSGTVNETRITVEYNNPNLLPTKVTTASGNGAISSAVAYAYDDRRNLISVDGPLAGTDDTTTYIYDTQDRRRGVIGPDPDGAGTRLRAGQRYSFDAESKVTKVESGTVTAATAAALDAMSVVQIVDITYDTKGNKVKEVVTGKSGATTATLNVAQYDYDGDNRLLCSALRMNPATWAALPSDACTPATASTTYGADRISRNSYDNQGRVTKVESALGTAQAADEVRTAYTANGLVDHVIDAESNRTAYIYDGHNRLVQTRYPVTTKGANASNASDYEALTYDARSSVTKRRLRDATEIDYSYDDLGRLTTKDLPGSEATTTYAYDLLGRALSVVQGAQTHSFVHNALGQVTSQTGPLGTIGYAYDVAGRRTSMSYPGGVLTIAYDYDIAGNVTKIRENGAMSGVGVLASYTFDAIGRREKVTFGNGSEQVFTYGTSAANFTMGRVTGIANNLGGSATTHDLTQTFNYNPAGQIASVARSNDAYAWQAHYNVDRSYVADGLNRIMNAGGFAFGYDGRGNLTSDGTNAYTYTAENLLKTAPGSATLDYDPLGRLYQTAKSGVTTRFLYDGIDMIGEYDDSNAVQRRYVHGPGIDNPIVWYEGSAINSATRRFLMADERGSVVSITDSAGATLNMNSYDEYGIPAPGNLGRFGYTGQSWLPEVGLWYYKARIYSPTLGRFMQTDPIGYADGMNWYNYVGSDPVNYVDPLGLAVVCFPAFVKTWVPAPKQEDWTVAAGQWSVLEISACGDTGPDGTPPGRTPQPTPSQNDTPDCNKIKIDLARRRAQSKMDEAAAKTRSTGKEHGFVGGYTSDGRLFLSAVVNSPDRAKSSRTGSLGNIRMGAVLAGARGPLAAKGALPAFFVHAHFDNYGLSGTDRTQAGTYNMAVIAINENRSLECQNAY